MGVVKNGVLEASEFQQGADRVTVVIRWYVLSYCDIEFCVDNIASSENRGGAGWGDSDFR